MGSWKYFLYGFVGIVALGLLVNAVFAGTLTGSIKISGSDEIVCIYRPEPGGNDDKVYAVVFTDNIECPETFLDALVEGDDEG